MANEDMLKTRWETEDGKDRQKRIVEAIQKGQENWPEILQGFLGVGKLENRYDLRRVDLSGCNLNGAILCNVCFEQANLSGAILDNANLDGASLSQANLDSASLIKTYLSKTQLNGASFENANLRKANASKSYLYHAKFINADIRGTNFYQSIICEPRVGMGYGQLSSKTDFREAKYNRKTSFLGVDITYNNWASNPLLKRHIEDQQWLNVWRNKNRFNKYFLYPIWLITCDCGRSFLLWACWSLVLAIAFGFIFANCANSFNLTAYDGKTLADAHLFMPFYYSIVTFTTLGFGDIVPDHDNWIMQFCVTLEVVLGYIMLGGLISILANKLARRA